MSKACIARKPDPFFVSAFDRFVSKLFPSAGDALDLAGGVGRHAPVPGAAEMARTVVDISEVAVGCSRKRPGSSVW